MTGFQKIMFVLLGALLAVGIFCLVIGIGCAVNGVTFGQQIVNWFGPAKEVVKDVVEETTVILKPII